MAFYLGSQRISGLVTEYSTTTTSTNEATATAADILQGKTAYVQGNKIVGTLGISSIYISESDVEPDNSVGNNGDIYVITGA